MMSVISPEDSIPRSVIKYLAYSTGNSGLQPDFMNGG
jgi:hypothetical protein